MKNYKRLLKITFQKPTIKKGFIISAIVGTLLNLINQGHLLLASQFPKVSVLKMGLTYLIPFVVSVYSTTSTIIQQQSYNKYKTPK